jgi:hypothetical protein
MSAAWRLRWLPRIPFELEASQAAALRKKTQLDETAIRRSFVSGQMIPGTLQAIE